MRLEGYGMGFGLAGMLAVALWAAMVVLVVALLVLAVRWLVRADQHGRTPGSQPTPPAGRDPLEILRERYARGEIDDDEFERRRRTLGG